MECANLGGADLEGANLEEANLTGADLFGAEVTDEQLAQAASLEGATLPDGTKHTSKAEPAPAEPETDNAEGRPDQPGDLDAGEGVEGPTSAWAHNQKLTFHVIGAKRRGFFVVAPFALSETPRPLPGGGRGSAGQHHRNHAQGRGQRQLPAGG
jgi:hypothetical protein